MGNLWPDLVAHPLASQALAGWCGQRWARLVWCSINREGSRLHWSRESFATAKPGSDLASIFFLGWRLVSFIRRILMVNCKSSLGSQALMRGGFYSFSTYFPACLHECNMLTGPAPHSDACSMAVAWAVFAKLSCILEQAYHSSSCFQDWPGNLQTVNWVGKVDLKYKAKFEMQLQL